MVSRRTQPASPSSVAREKGEAGARAALLVEDHMVLGLGTGSTARFFIEALAQRVASEQLEIKGVATSLATAELALGLGIELIELPAQGVDLAVDGADAVDPLLRLLKGRGGAHVHERIVAASAERFVVIVDSQKLVDRLHGPVALELLSFGLARTLAELEECHGRVQLRLDATGKVRRSDDGNVLADLMITELGDLEQLAVRLDETAGVVGHGIFLDLADVVLVAEGGGVRELRRPDDPRSSRKTGRDDL